MTSDTGFRVTNRAHRLIVAISKGKLGWSAKGMPVVQLTTTGRRSGVARTTMVTSPFQEGSTTMVVASRGGDDRDPDWLLNVRANPEVVASIGGQPEQSMLAEEAGPEERARLWPIIVTRQKQYGDYQAKTERQIPVVLLRPRPN
jgi:deazaflavin-dependent oxidoreductase (nitroreductase family)